MNRQAELRAHCEKVFEYSLNGIHIIGDEWGTIVGNWCQPHRFYHGPSHLLKLFDEISSLSADDLFKLKLRYVALFHDIVYLPGYPGNVDKSVEIFQEYCRAGVVDDDVAKEIEDAILCTSDHKPTNDLGLAFCKLDLAILDAEPVAMLEWEKGIFKEYQRFSVEEYRKGRLEFLYGHVDEHPRLRFLIDYLENHFRPRVAIYAGSFNPFHVGHMNILEKAERLFDKVVLAEGRNPEKGADPAREYGYFPFHEVVRFECLLPELVRAYSEHADVTVVKGLRNGYDLNYEVNQLRFMQDYNPDINVVYIACDSEFEHISSSALRGIKSFESDIQKYLPHKYNYL